jgi:UDP:flavonoid glycosyltransferase YjiC (YdhE family)
MKILLPVIGVRGDVQLFIALAKALNNKGYEATVALNQKFVKLAEYYGVNYYSLGGEPDDGVKEMQEIIRANNNLEAAKLGTEFFFQGVREHTKTLQELCPRYDLIIGYGSFGLAEADKANKPFISVVIDPTMAEKKFSKNIKLNMGLIVEKIALYLLMGRKYEQFRKEIGAPSSSKSNNPPMIILPMSHEVVKPNHNWTNKNVVTGYWYLESPSNYSPPEDLLEFIEAGKKPLFISFGSATWSEEDNSALMEILFEGVLKAGERAIILNTENYSNKIPDHIHLVQEIPYDWLLDHVWCVIHHCGLGTTAEVLKAGLPSIPVPFMVDQFAWAERIHSLGVATYPIPRKKLTMEKLSKAIIEIRDNSLIRDNAKTLGHKIRKENGLKSAVTAIESIVTSQMEE